MATSLDVAEYILQQKGPVSSMKLQKLVYYAQAWALALQDGPLFEDTIEAWPSGPVIRKLMQSPGEETQVHCIPQGDPARLNGEQKETIDAVIVYYGQKSTQWLQTRIHAESPWQQARQDASGSGRGKRKQTGNRISREAMKEFYSGLEGHC